MFEPLSCSKSCNVWTRARTGGDTAKQGRHRGAVPAADPQRVGPGHEELDRDAIKRLVGSLTRLLDPTAALAATTTAGSERLAFTSSRPVGGTLVLDALWRRLGIDTVMTRLLTGR